MWSPEWRRRAHFPQASIWHNITRSVRAEWNSNSLVSILSVRLDTPCRKITEFKDASVMCSCPDSHSENPIGKVYCTTANPRPCCVQRHCPLEKSRPSVTHYETPEMLGPEVTLAMSHHDAKARENDPTPKTNKADKQALILSMKSTW